MPSLRFAAWTRRRFGLAAGVGVAALLGLGQLPGAAAKKKKKPRCKKLGKACQPTGKKKRCCKPLACSDTSARDNVCCKPRQATCVAGTECCGPDIICDDSNGLSGDRCCGPINSSCDVDADCCSGLNCDGGACL